MVGFGEVLAHGSGALVGRGVPGGVGWGCRRGKRTELGVNTHFYHAGSTSVVQPFVVVG